MPLGAQDGAYGRSALRGGVRDGCRIIDAELGGGVVKKRVALPGRGKIGGARTLVATNKDNRWFFVFGFEKNERANITKKELEALQSLATDLLNLESAQLDAHVESEALQEICHEEQD